MVRRVAVLLTLLFTPVLGLAAVLDIALSDSQVEMGKYLSVRIVYDGEATVGAPDLQQWNDDFFVELRDSETESLVSGEIRTTQHLRLYPMDIGAKVLERIALGSAVAGPVDISVSPSVRDGVDGTPRWLPAPGQIWQGQTFEIGVELALLHPSNHIAVEEAVFRGFDVESLGRERIETAEGETIRLGWRLTAQDQGHYRIDLPAIEQRGRGRWRFYLRPAEIEVLPLPSYLPPSLPVGTLMMETSVLRVGDAPFWQVTLKDKGRLPDEAYGVRTALAAIAGVNPELVTISAVERADDEGLVSMQRYRVAVPGWSAGLGDGPVFSLRYFDTGYGQLRTLASHLPPVWRLPAAASYALAAGMATVLAFLLFAVYRGAKRAIARYRFRQALLDARDAHALRRLLLGTGPYATLGAWAVAARDDAADQIASQLNALCFAPRSAGSLSGVKLALRGLLRPWHPLSWVRDFH